MVELLKVAANVPTLLGILGMALVVALFIYYLRLRSEEIKLSQIPKDQRAQAFDTYLTRYKIRTQNLNAQQIYELIRLELEKRTSRVTLFTIVVATVFLTCFTILAILQRGSPHQAEKSIPGDLTPVFGKVGALNRVRNVPRDENTKLLREWVANSQKSIKIVTINGSSWIKPNLMATFEEATARVPVTLMLLDFTEDRSRELFNEAMRQYGESIWPRKQFEENFLEYSDLLRPGSQLTLGLYQEYPWTRFTIFDDRAVSFIVTPVVEAGDSVQTYYSEDPFVVQCFNSLFERIKENANRRGRLFSDSATAKKFVSLQKSTSH